MKTFSQFKEGYTRGEDVRVIAKGHEKHGKMGVIFKSDKGSSTVKFPDGQKISFVNDKEITLVDMFESLNESATKQTIDIKTIEDLFGVKVAKHASDFYKTATGKLGHWGVSFSIKTQKLKPVNIDTIQQVGEYSIKVQEQKET